MRYTRPKQKTLTLLQRKGLLQDVIIDMKKEKYSIVVINGYQDQLIQIEDTISKNKQHDNKRKLLFKHEESMKV